MLHAQLPDHLRLAGMERDGQFPRGFFVHRIVRAPNLPEAGFEAIALLQSESGFARIVENAGGVAPDIIVHDAERTRRGDADRVNESGYAFYLH